MKKSPKVHNNRLLSIALFLIGIVLLMESAATMFVLVESPQVASGTMAAAWVYVMLKSLVSLFVIFVGFVTVRK
ncbi:MAG: hypothetical protein WC613_05270 [Candidatus Aenigmatarchaeota archaeon]